MKLLDILKKGGLQGAATATPATVATHSPYRPPTVASVATVAVANPEQAAANAPGNTSANDPAPDPDRYCWPHSIAMNGSEIDTFTARLARFTDKGMDLADVERLADALCLRDREASDLVACAECQHLAVLAGRWRCCNWQAADMAHDALALRFVVGLHRCTAYAPADAAARAGTPRRGPD